MKKSNQEVELEEGGHDVGAHVLVAGISLTRLDVQRLWCDDMSA